MLTAETITNLNPLTYLPILRLFQPAGRLDALANCTALTDLNLGNCWALEGQSYARSGSLFLTCTANRRDHHFNSNFTVPSTTGSFESLAGLVSLRSINVGGCEQLDCSRALELLASWDWSTQLESLSIWGTNVEGQLK